VAVDEPFDISVSYEKSSDTLSVDTIDTQSSSPVDPADPVSPAFKINWQWLIGFAAAGLIGYGIFTYFGIGRPASSKPRRKRTRAAGKKPQASSAAASVYCHNCGTQAFKGDKFCRECGTKLRV
jgi:hypothetical protein